MIKLLNKPGWKKIGIQNFVGPINLGKNRIKGKQIWDKEMLGQNNFVPE